MELPENFDELKYELGQTPEEFDLSTKISQAEKLADLITLMDNVAVIKGTNGETEYTGAYLKDVLIRVGARKEFGLYGAEYITRAHGLREKFMEITGIKETPDDFDPEGSLVLKKADLPTIKEYATGILEKKILPLKQNYEKAKEMLTALQSRQKSFLRFRRPSENELRKAEENLEEARLNIYTGVTSNTELIQELKTHGLDLGDFETEPALKNVLLDELNTIRDGLLP